MRDLFNLPKPQPKGVPIWKPVALDKPEWPPSYKSVYAWRIKQLAALRADPALVVSALAYYATRPTEFIMHWMDTYNPRKSKNKWMPFVFFRRQMEFIHFLQECRMDGANGLTEKSRDMGATWAACGYTVWSWLFIQNDAIGWGSRKQDLVDKIGNPDSIFEKMRLILRRLPLEFLPPGFNQTKHATYMRFINPANGSVIMGEAGDNIGRGGRTSMYFKDEAAHYERPELIEAALGDNTNVQIDISSVNGLGNVFHRRRKAGIDWQPGGTYEPGYTRVFVMDWRDHPEKTQEWYDTRKAKHEREGMLHVFAQEVDRNYSAAIQNTLIPYEWITAAVDAHLTIPCLRIPPPDLWGAALDVADGGIDRNALAKRQWIIWRSVEEWGERDPGVSTRRTLASCRQHRGIKIQYDSIGIGASVKSEFNRLVDDKIIAPDEIRLVPWNAGAAVQEPYAHIIPDDEDSLINKDFFQNMKAQAWWSMRSRFYKVWSMIEAIKNHEPIPNYSAEELISLDSSMPLLASLMQELAQPTRIESGSLKTMIEKQPPGTKSPNLADAGVMMFFPAIDDFGQVLIGKYGS